MNRGRIFACLLCALVLALSDPGMAQLTSRSTFARLTDVQRAWDDENYDRAFSMLERLASQKGLGNYDAAVTQQYIAHTALLADQPERARQALEAALAFDDLPDKLLAPLKLSLGQLALADEKYEHAKTLLEDWFRLIDVDPQASQLFSVAYANYMTGNLPRAETLLEDIVELEDANPSWPRVYYQVLFEQQKFDEAERILYRLLNLEPGNSGYWRMLANHYVRVEKRRRALAALAIADAQAMLTETSDRERLASMYGFVEAPERAARILEATLGEDAEPAASVLERIGNLWLLARERPRALDYLQRAAAAAPNGRLYELIGSLLFEDEQWAAAHDAFRLALSAGDSVEPPRVALLAGVSAMRAGLDDAARQALESAKASEKHRAYALSMLRELDES